MKKILSRRLKQQFFCKALCFLKKYVCRSQQDVLGPGLAVRITRVIKGREKYRDENKIKTSPLLTEEASGAANIRSPATHK